MPPLRRSGRPSLRCHCLRVCIAMNRRCSVPLIFSLPNLSLTAVLAPFRIVFSIGLNKSPPVTPAVDTAPVGRTAERRVHVSHVCSSLQCPHLRVGRKGLLPLPYPVNATTGREISYKWVAVPRQADTDRRAIPPRDACRRKNRRGVASMETARIRPRAPQLSHHGHPLCPAPPAHGWARPMTATTHPSRSTAGRTGRTSIPLVHIAVEFVR